MTPDNDFFRLDQQAWFQDFVESELREMFDNTHPHDEIFFLDVPF